VTAFPNYMAEGSSVSHRRELHGETHKANRTDKDKGPFQQTCFETLLSFAIHVFTRSKRSRFKSIQKSV